MPLVDLPREQVFAAFEQVLSGDKRVASAEREPEMLLESEPDHHASMTLVVEAPSASAARVVVEQVHDTALKQVRALVPEGAKVGWTSGFQIPESVLGRTGSGSVAAT